MPQQMKCRVKVSYKGKTVETDGTIDTGNTLHEPFSGECVIVSKAELFRQILDAEYFMQRRKYTRRGTISTFFIGRGLWSDTCF